MSDVSIIQYYLFITLKYTYNANASSMPSSQIATL